LGYLWNISGIGKRYDQVLNISGISFEVLGISKIENFGIFGISYNRKFRNGVSQINEKYPIKQILEWDIPK
jgi:hypothetical protein